MPNSCMIAVASAEPAIVARSGAPSRPALGMRLAVRFRTRYNLAPSLHFSGNISLWIPSMNPGKAIVCLRGPSCRRVARHAETLGQNLGRRIRAMDAACVPYGRGCTRLHRVGGRTHQLGATVGLEHHHFLSL